MIFHGPDGTGKWSAAEAFIQQKLCEVQTGCGNCSTCKKLLSGNHADYIRFPQEKVAIGEPTDPEVFTVRWLLKTRIIYSPFDAPLRFVLFPRADLIQHEAETALLKTLEEPPEHTRFIFLVRSLDEIKQTIVSRGVCIPFGLLPREELKHLGEIPPETLDLLGGSMELLPFVYTDLFNQMREKIRAGLEHPLSLLELERWLHSGERKGFAELTGEEKYSYAEILEQFTLLLLVQSQDHERAAAIRRQVFRLKLDLHLDMAGMQPYILGRFFNGLDRILFLNGKNN